MTKEPCIWVGSTGYLVTPELLKRIKRCAAYARQSWQPIAARPDTAAEYCCKVEFDMANTKLAGNPL